jgi:hypothetical protein
VLRLILDEQKGVPIVWFKPRQPMKHSKISAAFVTAQCFLRGLHLFLSTTPRTPLRVLCIVAFDTMHVLRKSKPMPRHRISVLAAALDFGAFSNAALDHKAFCPQEYQRTCKRLEDAGISAPLSEYQRRLRELERRRPSPGGDHRCFMEVRRYRESVARLSLGMVATITLGDEFIEDWILEKHDDDDLEILFKIVMQCQIIDDVLDYVEDASAGLPSFLTSSASLPQATNLSALATQSYSRFRDLPQSEFPFRIALPVVSTITKLVIQIHRWRYRFHGSRWSPSTLSIVFVTIVSVGTCVTLIL